MLVLLLRGDIAVPISLLLEGALDRDDRHVHVATLHERLLLDRGHVLEVLGETIEHHATLLGVGHLTTAEHDRDLDAGALLEEADDVTLLGLVVAHVDLGAELHLLDLDPCLVLAGGLGLAVLLVLELAIVEHLADRGLRVRRDLDEVETLVARNAQSVAHAEQTKLRAVDANQAARAGSDLLIDARTVVPGYRSHLPLVAALAA